MQRKTITVKLSIMENYTTYNHWQKNPPNFPTVTLQRNSVIASLNT